MYVIIWEFVAKRGHEQQFEHIYGSAGVWVELFKNGEGYLRTELLHDPSANRRFMTLDYWSSKDAHELFRKKNLRDYEKLDRRCAGLTDVEKHVGSFTTEGSKA